AGLLGNYVDVIGGRTNVTDLATLERARVDERGGLGAFEVVPEIGLATPRSGHTLAVYRGQLYVIGGESSGTALASVEHAGIYFDAQLGTFSARGMLHTERTAHSSIVLGDSVYVIR